MGNVFFFTFTEPEKNFALESYGANSKCFDHTESMWEERSCRQTREWQHWGSGCYQYECENRRLHILVSLFIYSINDKIFSLLRMFDILMIFSSSITFDFPRRP